MQYVNGVCVCVCVMLNVGKSVKQRRLHSSASVCMGMHGNSDKCAHDKRFEAHNFLKCALQFHIYYYFFFSLATAVFSYTVSNSFNSRLDQRESCTVCYNFPAIARVFNYTNALQRRYKAVA